MIAILSIVSFIAMLILGGYAIKYALKLMDTPRIEASQTENAALKELCDIKNLKIDLISSSTLRRHTFGLLIYFIIYLSVVPAFGAVLGHLISFKFTWFDLIAIWGAIGIPLFFALILAAVFNLYSLFKYAVLPNMQYGKYIEDCITRYVKKVALYYAIIVFVFAFLLSAFGDTDRGDIHGIILAYIAEPQFICGLIGVVVMGILSEMKMNNLGLKPVITYLSSLSKNKGSTPNKA